MPNEYIWNIKSLPSKKKIQELSDAINTNPIVSALLIQRGISNFEEAKSFFRPSLNQLHNPFLMKDMDIAVNRLIKAVQNNEKVLIYGDYDVDGTTSVALVYNFLANHTSNLDYYIPDRYEEGYGISMKGIKWASKNQFSLIISLDCGIKGIKPIAEARKLGLDFIVCDHHTPAKNLPSANAVLDPKRADCNYPFKELSGCGVGFKLLQAFCLKTELNLKLLFSHLDLVAVSIAADIVPIVGENRILAYYGLKKLNKTPNIGFKALINISKLKPPLNISNVVFGIAPRINASGRIGHANETVSLLISNNSFEADRIASLINAKNQIRKDTQEQITKETLDMLKNNPVYKNRKSTVLFNPNWHKGVIGIVASKCVDEYYKPTIILTESNGLVTGSARSVSGFNIHEAILKCKKLVEHFGGHKYAAGLSLKKENLSTFVLAFEKAVSTIITKEQEKKQLKIDVEITLDLINYKFLNILNQMAPFGPVNLQPLFIAKNVTIKKALLLKKAHLKVNVEQNGVNYEGIAFNMPYFYSSNLEGKKINMVFNIEENNFRDIKKIQLKIKDLQFTK